MKSTSMRTITKDERLILDAVKARKYQHLTITVENGKIVLIRREETIKPDLVSSRIQSGSGETS